MSLKEKLDDLRKGFEAQVPPETLEVMHKATEDLRNSGILDRALKVGARGPGFELRNVDGVLIRSRELLAAGPMVLSFYRGKW